MSLRFQIAESLPRDSVSIRALLQIARIQLSTEIPTACVTFGAEPELLINPEFVEQHAQTPAKLQALIGHELLHIALGHTRRYTQCSPMDNLVFDCLINATWSKAHPTPEATALFRDFYSDALFPQCFLRPPDDWHPRERVRLPAALKGADFEGVAFVKEVYKRLWGPVGVSAWEIREAIRIGSKGFRLTLEAIIEDLLLLGGHEHAPDASGVSDARSLNAFLKTIADEYSAKLSGMPIESGGQARELLLPTPIIPTKVSARARLKNLFSYLAHGQGPARLGGHMEKALVIQTPVPNRDRRAIVQRQFGITPFFYQGESVTKRPRTAERVHIYLDVSGSMDSVIRPLYGAVSDCKDWVAEQVHLFSTKVEDISLTELLAGKLVTTGGTSIECVVRHMETHGVQRALILTDGFVGVPSPASARVLEKVRLAACWVGGSVNKRDIGRFVGRQTDLALS